MKACKCVRLESLHTLSSYPNEIWALHICLACGQIYEVAKDYDITQRRAVSDLKAIELISGSDR